MGKRLYVGNLPYTADDTSLRAAFEEGGRQVVDVHVVMDRESGRSRGFGFVEMSTDEEAQAAITSMNGRDLGGRTITVNEARERTDGPSGGGRRPGPGRR